MGRKMPVLLTRTSTLPKRSSAVATRCSCGFGRADVACDERDTLAGRVELAPRGVEDLLPPAGEDDGGALREEAGCGGLADPAAASGEDHDLAFELWVVLHRGLLRERVTRK